MGNRRFSNNFPKIHLKARVSELYERASQASSTQTVASATTAVATIVQKCIVKKKLPFHLMLACNIQLKLELEKKTSE